MEDTVPQLRVVLRPSFDPSGTVQDFAILLSVHSINIEPEDNLLVLHQNLWTYYQNGMYHISVWDSSGSLQALTTGSRNDAWDLRPDRRTAGNVTIRIRIPSAALKPIGLEIDQGGLVGIGRSFLPSFPYPDVQYSITIEWDLSGAPDGTRAVCSHGEGPGPNAKDGPYAILLDTVYMVGPIRSAHNSTQVSDDDCSCFTYWFGDLPLNLAAVQSFSAAVFPRMASHFKDLLGSYRVFFQRTHDRVSGRNAPGCSILQYDDSILPASDSDLVRLLTRHMVLNWVGLDDEDDGTNNEWYSDGIAQLYSVYLPFRFGQRTPDYFKSTINAFLTAYYTSPHRDAVVSNSSYSSSDLLWYAKQTAPFRACVYMLKTDSYTRRSSRERNAGVLRPIDEIVAVISERRRRGEKVQARDWLSCVSEWLGDEAAETYFRIMMDGGVMDLDDLKSSFGASHEPVAVDQELLCFGMNPESFDTKTVSGIIPGSRAEQAGLRNGDRILAHSWIWGCLSNFERMMEIVVARDGTEANLKFTYWPRDWRKARSWQVMKTGTE